MKKFFSVLLSILFAAVLFVTLLLGIVRFNFSYSTIANIASQALKPVSKALPQDNGGLFYPGSAKLSLAQLNFDKSYIENFDLGSIDMTNLDVNAVVQSYLDQAGIDASPEMVAEVLASPEAAAFIDKYAEEVVDYMTGAKAELDINTDDIKKVLNKSIDIYEKHTGEVVDRSGMDKAVEESMQTAVPQITASLDAAKEENAQAVESLKWVKILLSLRTFILCAAACALLALIIFFINMNVFAMFKYVSIPAIVDGALLFAAAALCGALLPAALSVAAKNYGLPAGIYEAVWAYATTLFLQMKIWGGAAALLGIVLCALGFGLDKKEAKRGAPQSAAS